MITFQIWIPACLALFLKWKSRIFSWKKGKQYIQMQIRCWHSVVAGTGCRKRKLSFQCYTQASVLIELQSRMCQQVLFSFCSYLFHSTPLSSQLLFDISNSCIVSTYRTIHRWKKPTAMAHLFPNDSFHAFSLILCKFRLLIDNSVSDQREQV